MKICVNGWLHPKNIIGLDLLKKEGLCVDYTNNLKEEYDYIMNFDDVKTQNLNAKKIIHGPHIPFHHLGNFQNIKKPQYLNVLSLWLKNLVSELFKDINCIVLPFPVDINKFTPDKKTGKPVIYFKQRNPEILKSILSILGNDYVIFNYSNSYKEESFKDAISKAPYCIWLGRHESQGFAFQETLSSDTPIFVIDVKSLKCEYGNSVFDSHFPNQELKATAASYFDETCGLITSEEKWMDDFKNFLDKNYSPRNFIIENLSPTACFKMWKNLIEE